MITCKEVSTLVASGSLESTSLTTRLRVRVHLLMCRHCRAFKRQLATLAAAVSALNKGFAKEPAADFEERVAKAAGRSRPD